MSRLNIVVLTCVIICLTIFSDCSEVLADSSEIARGRYLSIISGCNDCHTTRFAETGGAIPESDWLKGDSLGWNGPWGTTYPTNLRLLVSQISSDSWVQLLKTSKARPPMPAYVFKTMTEDDMRALYTFIYSLGAAGTAAPAGLPPGTAPKTPFINFVPVVPPGGNK